MRCLTNLGAAFSFLLWWWQCSELLELELELELLDDELDELEELEVRSQ